MMDQEDSQNISILANFSFSKNKLQRMVKQSLHYSSHSLQKICSIWVMWFWHLLSNDMSVCVLYIHVFNGTTEGVSHAVIMDRFLTQAKVSQFDVT